MPQLKRLSATASATAEASAATAEQLLAQPLHELTQRALRKHAADACAAPGVTMEAMLDGDGANGNRDETNYDICAKKIDSMQFADCVRAAIGAAGGGFKSLFIVSSALDVVKRLRLVLEADGVDVATRDAVLRCIDVRQTREIHVLLSTIQDTGAYRLVFLGPLSVFFSPFLTATGLSTTGDGLLRMVHLACKRSSTSKITIIQAP